MMVGVASGTYSSIFIASPVLTEWKEREPAYRSRRARIKEAMGFVPTFPEDNVVARIDEVERHAPAEAGAATAARTAPPEAEPADGAGRGRRARDERRSAVADPPVERDAPAPSRPPRRPATGVAGRPEAERRAHQAAAKPPKKQSRRRRKHGRSRR